MGSITLDIPRSFSIKMVKCLVSFVLLLVVLVNPSQACNQTPYNCVCGAKGFSRNKRIVNGDDATKNEYPWQVALKRNGERRPTCSGALLNSDTVITSASCKRMLGDTNNAFMVGVGEHDVTRYDGSEQWIRPKKFILHPQSNPSSSTNHLDYDLGIIKLSTPVTFTRSVQPICLPSEDMIIDKAILTGWGSTDRISGGTLPDTLKEVTLRLNMGNEDCKAYPGYAQYITDRMFCAMDENKGACGGDSGAPLVAEKNGKHYLVGIASFILPDPSDHTSTCGKTPTVFSSVYRMMPWIRAEMTGQTCPNDQIQSPIPVPLPY